MLVADQANKDLLKELNNYNLNGREVSPGQTIYGIIGIQDDTFLPLTLRRINKPVALTEKPLNK